MKATDVWSVLHRSALSGWARAHGFRRRGSSAAYSRALETGSHVTVWFKHRSGGWDAALGGKFTGALQLAAQPAPGIEWTPDPGFRSQRLYKLFGAETWGEAVTIHNTATGKLRRPAEGHWLYTLPEDARRTALAVLEPRTRLDDVGDYWFVYHDAEDITAWGHLLARALPALVARWPGPVG